LVSLGSTQVTHLEGRSRRVGGEREARGAWCVGLAPNDKPPYAHDRFVEGTVEPREAFADRRNAFVQSRNALGGARDMWVALPNAFVGPRNAWNERRNAAVGSANALDERRNALGVPRSVRIPLRNRLGERSNALD
jgi:hypothetical protein